ncbi:DUF4783 domain-containing protein [Thermophagus sp. OGC60D27]|uniref:DUF4783 domain-containing protein n=1 Tax=Thermophagus sp. OGC60D27 TaxID=3458415 RepID=UPI004037B45B
MKKIRQLLPFLVFFLAIGFLDAQTAGKAPLPPKVVEAVKKGDANALTSFLNDKIELVLPGKTGIFSRQQAHFILKDFFSDHKVASFHVLHYGSRQSATFAIGEYKCVNEHFRIYFLVKKSGDNRSLIHQIRIEKQE